MKHTFGKKQLALSVIVGSFAIAAATAAPQASAHSVQQLEDRLQVQLEAIQKQLDEIKAQSLQNQLDEIKAQSAQEAQKVTRIEKTVSENRKSSKNNMIFFRGGFAHAMQDRNGVTLQSNVVPAGAQNQGDNDAWYIGAGFDFGLTKDAWGFAPRTEVLAELMFEYKRFGAVQGNGLANSPTQLTPISGAHNPRQVTVSQFTLTAAPKIKFLEGSKLRPWIIPAGLAIHVISPPSESITVLTPGVMFAAGADYNIWKDFYVGVDARYHYTGGKHDGVNIDGLTAGGYVGIGF